jgi:hypothetical protein
MNNEWSGQYVSTFLNIWGSFCVPPSVTEVTIHQSLKSQQGILNTPLHLLWKWNAHKILWDYNTTQVVMIAEKQVRLDKP